MSPAHVVETVPGPYGVNRIVLRRVPIHEAAALREAALPLNVPFTAPAAPPEPKYGPERPPCTPAPATSKAAPHRPSPRTVTCSHCGTAYRSRSGNHAGEHRFCSRDCRQKAWVVVRAERRRAGRVEERYCDECRAVFPPTPPDKPYPSNKRFCSEACQYQAKNRERREARADAKREAAGAR